ncbi:fungal cellulose binding domain-containing protein [Apiospora kogelbergensis]|uniref:Mannan endo-1,4-beta-mannosidase A n=1 Tax=Apiospora kogelbergensis TaxID=1337665 RepID=A0AAW0QWL4_9PEZI
MKYLSTGLLSFSGAVSAQQQLWGQCGGLGYSGIKTCVEGAVCQVSNEYYSQCIPGTAVPTSAAPSTTLQTSVKPGGATSTKIKVPASTSFASASGTKFNVDGSTKYLAGTNSYWISFLTSNADVEKALDTLVDSGLKVLRIWGFNDVTAKPGSGTVYFQQLSAGGSTINTGVDGLQRLDYVVAAAEIRGLKLIINFVNNWDDYGGIAAYVRAFGGSKTSWYTNTAAQAQYRKYVQAVVSRYANSPAIFAWELANEPRCNGCSTDVIYNWAASTSAYVKSLDPNHMVTLGDEGMGLPGDGSYPYQYGEGTDFVKNLGIKTLDFGTFHMYPDHWGTNYNWGNGWIEAHGKACVAAGKPCMLEEYGTTTNHCQNERPWQKTSLATSGMASDLFWQLGVQLSNGPTHDDGFTVYDGTSDWTCLVTEHVAGIK